VSGPDTIRGQPLLVLAVILGAWLVGRVLLWTPPFPIRTLPPTAIAHRGHADEFASLHAASAGEQAAARSTENDWRAPGPSPAPAPETKPWPRLAQPISAPPYLDWRSVGATRPGVTMEPTARRAAGHQMLLAAAFANPRLPAEFGGTSGGAGRHSTYVAGPSRLAPVDRPLLGAGAASEARERRFSGDAWVLWREGSATAAAPGISAYGRSQAGAVLRYSLLPNHLLLPALYARVTRTIEGPRQAEVAVGLSLRPLAGVPVSVAAEARVTETASGREVRPAAFAVTQLPPLALPLGLRGEAYLQGGYVGGRFETPFVDGQARTDRRVVRLGEGQEVRAGLAAWGGAQKGAARLDVGPSASVAFKLGGASSRIALDYRLRVAGDAAPSSGPAVTFSAGF
jgi:hypothetical protein